MRMSEIFEQLEIELPGRPPERAPGAARRSDADRPRLRGASGRRGMGLDAQGLRRHPRHHLARHPRRHGPRRRARWRPSSRSAMRAGTAASSRMRSRRTPGSARRPTAGIIFDMPFESRWLAAGRLLGRRALPHQSDQRQCLMRRPRDGRDPAERRGSSSRRSTSASGASASPAATASAAPPRRSEACPRDREGPQWGGIDALMRDWRPAVLVVGLPYNADGSEGAAAAAARGFAAELGERYALPVQARR